MDQYGGHLGFCMEWVVHRDPRLCERRRTLCAPLLFCHADILCSRSMLQFIELMPSSFVEERAIPVVWRFWTGPTVSIDDDPPNTTSTSDTSPTTTIAATSSLLSESHHSDRSWARRQAAEARNHIFDSLGERYRLRIIPGQNSFLVLPSNISRLTAVCTILHPEDLLVHHSVATLVSAMLTTTATGAALRLEAVLEGRLVVRAGGLVLQRNLRSCLRSEEMRSC
ncbi:hypothetical protein EDD17DRAFT_864385 [Pisolithus thermaeus]|nr:hypothetical protein EDD17DRAFT_864385 [Pisolithus thermaeus]